MTLISRLVFFQKKKTEQKSSEQLKSNEISIVIPVKDNQKGIDRFLTEFFKTHVLENYPKEIIIVDNNSEHETVIKPSFIDFGLPIHLCKCSKIGPAAARNFGVQTATGKWILFNDSDCIPTPTLISGYIKACNSSIAYAGNVKSVKLDFLSKYYESQEILIPLKTRKEKNSFSPQYLITANSLVWKEAFDSIGGFNERIKIAGGEDIDLGLRLSEIGDLTYAFGSIALHDFSDGLIGFFKRFIRYGQGNKLVEYLWKTNLEPKLFRPNERTLVNEILAKLQYLFLRIGYLQAQRTLKRDGW